MPFSYLYAESFATHPRLPEGEGNGRQEQVGKIEGYFVARKLPLLYIPWHSCELHYYLLVVGKVGRPIISEHLLRIPLSF